MKKYKVIYADPPWAYKVWSKKGAGRSAESHYPTMDIAAIKALPVGELADKDCALFLWITFPMLREAWGVMDAWGFTFKTVAFVWIKQCRKSEGLFTGMGYWTRANAEICLLATRGRPKRAARDVKQVILSHVERHSQKPEEARRRIEALMGDVPHIYQLKQSRKRKARKSQRMGSEKTKRQKKRAGLQQTKHVIAKECSPKKNA